MANPALERNPYFNGQARNAQPQAAGYGQSHYGQANYGQPQAAPQYGQHQPQWQQYPGAGAQQQAPSADALNHQYNLPSPSADQLDRMTIEDTIAKGAILFGLLAVIAAGTWALTNAQPAVGLALAIAGSLVALVLGLVIAFSKKVRVGAIVAFSVAEGLLVGGYSAYLEMVFPGVVIQAVLATIIVVGVTLALFSSGKVRTSPKVTKFFLIAGAAYLVFSLVNFGLMMFNVTDQPWGLRSVEVFGIPLGVLLGLFAVLMGAYLLIMDFEFVQNGVRSGAPRKYGWLGAYAVVSTVVYIYLEILRLIAILRSGE